MKIKNKDIVELYSGLKGLANLSGAKFAYAVARNLAILKSEIRLLQKAGAPSQEFIKYEEERFDLATEHAKKKDGKPLTELINGIEKFVLKDKVEFEKKYVIIRKKHLETINKRKKQLKEVEELMEVESEVDLFMIPQSYVPDEINTNQMAGILPIIRE